MHTCVVLVLTIDLLSRSLQSLRYSSLFPIFVGFISNLCSTLPSTLNFPATYCNVDHQRPASTTWPWPLQWTSPTNLFTAKYQLLTQSWGVPERYCRWKRPICENCRCRWICWCSQTTSALVCSKLNCYGVFVQRIGINSRWCKIILVPWDVSEKICMGTRSLVTFKVYDLCGATRSFSGSVNVNCKYKQETLVSGLLVLQVITRQDRPNIQLRSIICYLISIPSHKRTAKTFCLSLQELLNTSNPKFQQSYAYLS